MEGVGRPRARLSAIYSELRLANDPCKWKDITKAAPSGGADCCRLYRNGSVLKAQGGANGRSPRRRSHGGWREMLAVLPAIGVALLPKLTCPACWPA